jgi:hypothetical protein
METLKSSTTRTNHLIGFQDAILVFFCVVALMRTFDLNGAFKTWLANHSTLSVILAFLIYLIVAMAFFGQTIAMKLFKQKLYNIDDEEAGLSDRLWAACFMLRNDCDYCQWRNNA